MSTKQFIWNPTAKYILCIGSKENITYFSQFVDDKF